MGSPANLTLGTSTGACAVDAAEYLHALQEEKGKIEAFKRELPICMHLIDQAIESARQRATDDNCSADSKKHTSSSAPVLENFMPLKRRWERHNVTKAEVEDQEEDEDHKEAVVVGRPAWMGEAHLWTQQQQQHQQHHHHSHQDSQAGARSSSRLLLSSKHRQGGAFVPFNRDRQQLSSPPFSPPPNSTPEAAAPGHTDGDNNSDMVGSVDVTRSRERSSSDVRAQRVSVDHTKTSGAAQPPRKARRCWSPELHRRFVHALQQLGGSQVATPKQIRELMKVDGLTNDEVKSHLQKYRLHTRQPSPPPTSPPPVVILGWVPPECGVTQPAATTHVLQDQYKSTASAQPQMRSPQDHSKKHHLSPASQISSLRGPSPGRGESPHSSTDSYLDEDSDSEEHDQEIKCSTSTSHEAPQQHEEISNGCKSDQHALRESKGSSTRLADIDDTTVTKAVKLQTLRKTRAAA